MISQTLELPHFRILELYFTILDTGYTHFGYLYCITGLGVLGRPGRLECIFRFPTFLAFNFHSRNCGLHHFGHHPTSFWTVTVQMASSTQGGFAKTASWASFGETGLLKTPPVTSTPGFWTPPSGTTTEPFWTPYKLILDTWSAQCAGEMPGCIFQFHNFSRLQLSSWPLFLLSTPATAGSTILDTPAPHSGHSSCRMSFTVFCPILPPVSWLLAFYTFWTLLRRTIPSLRNHVSHKGTETQRTTSFNICVHLCHLWLDT